LAPTKVHIDFMNTRGIEDDKGTLARFTEWVRVGASRSRGMSKKNVVTKRVECMPSEVQVIRNPFLLDIRLETNM
jgi:hypothetical protein